MDKIKFTVVSLIIGIFALLAWFKFISLSEVLNEFKSIKVLPVLIGAIFFTFSFVLKCLRWQAILSFVQKVNLKVLLKVYMVSNYLNIVSPLKFGEIIQGLLLKKLEKIPFSKGLPTIIIDRIFYLMATFCFFALAFPFFEFKLDPYLRFALLTVALGFFLIIGFLFLEKNKKNQILKSITILLFFLSGHFKERLHTFFDTFIDGLETISKQWRKMPLLIFVSFAVLLAEGAALFFISQALSFSIPYFICVIGVVMCNLLYIFPTPPGGIGTTEWYYSLIFIFGFGLPKEKLSEVIILFHLVTVAVIIIAGLYAIGSLGINIAQLKEEAKNS